LLEPLRSKTGGESETTVELCKVPLFPVFTKLIKDVELSCILNGS
jgi:hypothetical protein